MEGKVQDPNVVAELQIMVQQVKAASGGEVLEIEVV